MPNARATLLVVDDDTPMLLASEAILLRECYSVITASGAFEALRKSREFEGEIQLLQTDVVIHDMDGLKLARQIVAERPDLRVLLTSADPTMQSRLPFLKKPFRLAQLPEAVWHIINGPVPDPSLLAEDATFGDTLYTALSHQLEIARRRYLASEHDFLQITEDVPSGLANSDGSLRVELKARSRRAAFSEYQQACARLEAYMAAREIK